MKKLNRKGFTLIELLAVIVILAIVLVVTIPSVISSMNTAKSSQLKNAADTVTEWFTKQYELELLGGGVGGGPASEYTTFGSIAATSSTSKKTLDGDVLKAAGVTSTDGLSGDVYLNGNKVCIELIAGSASQFYNASGTNSVTGSGC